jgi:hypothetical protein
VIEVSAVSNGAADVERPHVGDRFVDYEKLMVGDSRQFEGLPARARVRDDVPMLLEDTLQGPTHPVIAAGNQSKRWTFNGELH